MNKIVKIILIVVGLAGAALWFMLPERDAPVGEATQNAALNAMFWITYILLGIAAIVALAFSLIHLFSDPASIKKTVFVVVGFLLVVAIAYVLADGTDVSVPEMADRGIETSESTIKKIGTGINVFWILTIIAVGAMIWGGVRKTIIKK
ncbi:hypothetical protein SAMN05421636_103434 [Pricia antarctica]|uniref:Uncharacterized protein n=1 Tax=Pricia antarctica TaxID=641691 RepID=A0A1G7AKY1_9FLAO|nr:hypothetical protein [Pricia antarctica]SDE15499.1 hypothetical protein SAMN05421636_103434 [Pricia antarctica]